MKKSSNIPKWYPKYIRRISDGELFSINDDGTYSSKMMKNDFPNSLINKFSYDTLINKHKGFFEIVYDSEPEKMSKRDSDYFKDKDSTY